MLALLMIGFASRPSVSAALTDGHVLLHPFDIVAVASIEDTATDYGHVSFTKCVSLGVLPSGWVVTPPPKALVPTTPTTASRPVNPVYSILRPPRFAA